MTRLTPKIRVLEVLATLRRAGAETVAVSLARGLDRNRFETAVVSLYAPFDGGFEPVLAADGVPVDHLGKRRGFDPRMWPRLAASIRRFRPSIVHTHSYVMRYAWPASAIARQGRIVHTVHNFADKEVEPFGRALHRFAFRAGAVPVAISDGVASSFRDVYGYPPAAVIPNGVAIGVAAPVEAGDTWRRTLGIAPEDFLVVSVARLEPQKNPGLLIEAFARAFASTTAAHLALAGDGSLLEPSRRLAEALGIARRVHWLGVVADIPGLLSACDLFALSSAWEGSPVAVVEAMAAGLPVVATAVGGVPELVEENATGILVASGDVPAFAAALAAMAADPERRRTMGAAAQKRAARFDRTSMVRSYATLFEKLAGGRK